MDCKECKEPLGKVPFTRGDSFICLNWTCHLYRQGQAVKVNRRPLRYNKPPGGFANWDSYRKYSEDRKANYRRLAILGFNSQFCHRFKSNKQTKRIAALAKRGLSITYITKMLGDGHG